MRSNKIILIWNLKLVSGIPSLQIRCLNCGKRLSYNLLSIILHKLYQSSVINIEKMGEYIYISIVDIAVLNKISSSLYIFGLKCRIDRLINLSLPGQMDGNGTFIISYKNNYFGLSLVFNRTLQPLQVTHSSLGSFCNLWRAPYMILGK